MVTQDQWNNRYRRYYKRYTQHSYKGTTIQDRLEDLKKADPTAFRCLMTLINDPEMGLDILRSEMRFQTAIVESQRNLVPNQAFFTEFCQHTGLLSSVGKVVIISLMFIGRVGPITIVLSLMHNHQNRKTNNLVYPHGDVLIG